MLSTLRKLSFMRRGTRAQHHSARRPRRGAFPQAHSRNPPPSVSQVCSRRPDSRTSSKAGCLSCRAERQRDLQSLADVPSLPRDPAPAVEAAPRPRGAVTRGARAAGAPGATGGGPGRGLGGPGRSGTRKGRAGRAGESASPPLRVPTTLPPLLDCKSLPPGRGLPDLRGACSCATFWRCATRDRDARADPFTATRRVGVVGQRLREFLDLKVR